MTDRWVLLTNLVDETGYATRTLQYIRAQEPEVLVTRTRKGKTEYKQPACAINLRKREVARALAEAKPDASALADAGLRKAVADAEYSEMRSRRERELLVKERDAEAEAEIWRFCERVRAGILALRSRYQASMVGLRTIPEAGVALDRIAATLLTDLQRDAGGTHEVQDLEPATSEADVA
jgi:hypothetical protein